MITVSVGAAGTCAAFSHQVCPSGRADPTAGGGRQPNCHDVFPLRQQIIPGDQPVTLPQHQDQCRTKGLSRPSREVQGERRRGAVLAILTGRGLPFACRLERECPARRTPLTTWVECPIIRQSLWFANTFGVDGGNVRRDMASAVVQAARAVQLAVTAKALGNGAAIAPLPLILPWRSGAGPESGAGCTTFVVSLSAQVKLPCYLCFRVPSCQS